jgi:hypothetical protein
MSQGQFFPFTTAAPTPLSPGLTGYPPAGCAIRYEKTATGHLWTLPPSGKRGWQNPEWIALPLAAAFPIAHFWNRGPQLDWTPVLFFLPVAAILFAKIYTLHRKRNTQYRIALDDQRLTFSSQWRGRTKEQSLALAKLESVEQTSLSRQNGSDIVGIELKASDGRIRFGEWLTPKEKSWLVAEFNEAAWPMTKTTAPIPPTPTIRQESFSLLAPQSNRYPGSVILSLIGTLFIALALFAVKGDRTFQFVFGGMGGLALLSGLRAFVSHFRDRDTEQRIDGSSSHLVLRKTRKGLPLSEETFPRESFLEIRAVPSGPNSAQGFANLELLLSDRTIVLAQWLKPAEAIPFVEQVNQAMGR